MTAPETINKQKIYSFIVANFEFLTNSQLADQLHIKLSAVRHACYELGLKRMELEYFSATQINFLRSHYHTIGDCEFAELFQRKWPKNKGWTKKHIEKKRKYLRLKRTKKEIKCILARNKKAGRFSQCPVKAWDKRGRAPEGQIRYWKRKDGTEYPVIKMDGRFTPWARWTWQSKAGPIPKGSNVIFIDGNSHHLSFDNLILLSNAQLSQRNSMKSSKGLSDNYIAGILSHNNAELRILLKQNPHLLQVKRYQLILKRSIYEHGKTE
jgi:hypothetical protein